MSSLCCTRAPQIVLQRASLEHQRCSLQHNPVHGSGRLKRHLIIIQQPQTKQRGTTKTKTNEFRISRREQAKRHQHPKNRGGSEGEKATPHHLGHLGTLVVGIEIFHTQLCHPPSFTQHLSHHLRPTIFHTPSFTHNFVTHHLSHTSFTQLSHTFTHHLSHTTLSHTIFHTQLCHSVSFTHSFHTLSFTPNFVTHHLSSTSSFVFPSFPVPATPFRAHFWKKLTCGVIRSFNLCWVRHLVDDSAVAAGYFRLYVMRLPASSSMPSD